jgi:hypothetical protein
LDARIYSYEVRKICAFFTKNKGKSFTFNQLWDMFRYGSDNPLVQIREQSDLTESLAILERKSVIRKKGKYYQSNICPILTKELTKIDTTDVPKIDTVDVPKIDTVQKTPTNVIKFTRHEFDPYGDNGDLGVVHSTQFDNSGFVILCGLNADFGDCDFEAEPLNEGAMVDCPKCKAVQNAPIHTITDVNGETFKSTLDADMWHWMESLPNTPTKEAVQNTPTKEAVQNTPTKEAVQNTPTKEAVQNTPTTDIIKYSIAAILTRLDMQTKAISDQTGVNAAEIRAIKRQGSAISFDRALQIAIKLGQTTAFLSEIIKESAKVHQSITGEKMKPIKSIQKEIF